MFTELLELFEPLFPILATSILFIGGVALAIYGLVLVCKGLKLLFKKTISNMSLCADCIKNWIDSGFERLENTIKSAIKSANRSQTEDILKLVQPKGLKKREGEREGGAGELSFGARRGVSQRLCKPSN